MNQSALTYAFNLSILIGFVIPLLNLLTGWFGSFFGAGVDVDLDVDVDVALDTDIGLDAGMDAGTEAVGAGRVSSPVPFNVMCLCLFLVVFGAMGKMLQKHMTTLLSAVLLMIVCLILASVSYWALYRFLIKKLKDNDASALSYRNLRGHGGEVTLRIQGDSIGTISLRDSTGAAISFRARKDPHLFDQMPDVIEQGEPVVVTDVDTVNKICYVSVYKARLTGGKLQ